VTVGEVCGVQSVVFAKKSYGNGGFWRSNITLMNK
jgi:hypothetical protein